MKFDYSLYPGRKKYNNKFSCDNEEPIISIITPFYNSGKYIEQTARCILEQTYPNFEWIIVDDGSTDKESLTKLEEIGKADSRIKVFHKRNEGLACTRDYGAKKASKTSKYFVFLDDDDLINETFIECAYWTLETNKNASWAYVDVINFMGQEFLWRKWFCHEKELEENLLVAMAMVRKNAFYEVNGYNIKEKAVNEDWNFWLKLMAKGMFPVRMNFLGFWYRKKPSNESELNKSMQNRDITMKYINETKKTITEKVEAIQYPKQNYDWNYIPDTIESIKVPQIEKKEGKINILLIIPWMTVGGADKFNLELVKRSNKEKYHFTIVTTLPNTNQWRQEFEEHATVYDLTTFLDRKYWISFINYLIEKNKIDIIFNTNSTFGYNALPYLKIKHPNIPIIDYVHMEEWYNRNGGFSRDSSSMASVIDKTYVCNKNSEKILIEHFQRNKEDVGTVYIGVDEEHYDPSLFNKQEILKEKKISTKDKYVISYICRISAQKRPFLLLQIIKKLLKKRDDFVFIIAGDGPMLEGMKNEAHKLKIAKKMIFLGNVKDTEKIYAISDMIINCSIKEGLALTSYESLSMGVPVLSSDVGGQNELIDKNVGVIVPCLQKEEEIYDYNYKNEEIEPYVKGIIKILDNLEEYKSEARKRILNGFTINNMIENMENVFSNIIKYPNKEKIENAKKMQNNIDISKELITMYFAAFNDEFNWLAEKYNLENVDMNYTFEKNVKKTTIYEQTMEYKIKHPFYVILTKLHIYEPIKKLIRYKGKQHV